MTIFNIKIGISTTIKKPQHLTYWIKYHLSIGFDKLYIVFDDENEDFLIDNDPRIRVFRNDINWKQEISKLANMDRLISDTKEVMSRQITNFTNVRNYARDDNITWLLNIDCDELFYPQKETLSSIFTKDADSIIFKNYEMVPKRDNYENCFVDGVDFKTNPRIFNAYSNGKSAVRVNSPCVNLGVHRFQGGTNFVSSIGKILHYPSCNFNEYLSKYRILGMFEDKWWGSVKIPFKFHTDSRDIIAGYSALQEQGDIDRLEKTARDYYNKHNVYNELIPSSDIETIFFVRDQLITPQD